MLRLGTAVRSRRGASALAAATALGFAACGGGGAGGAALDAGSRPVTSEVVDTAALAGPHDAGRAAVAPRGTAAPSAADLPAVTPTAWGAELPPGALPAPAVRNRPVRLRIPAVGLDAPVVGAGVLPDGALDLPADTSTVAWFAGGPVPGESGSAVLAAHVDHDGDEGVFFGLSRLAPGTAIEVVLADGTSTRFSTAGAAQVHPKRALPLEQLFRRGAEQELTLITCGGAFDAAARSYEDNVVVARRPAPAP